MKKIKLPGYVFEIEGWKNRLILQGFICLGDKEAMESLMHISALFPCADASIKFRWLSDHQSDKINHVRCYSISWGYEDCETYNIMYTVVLKTEKPRWIKQPDAIS